MSKYNSWFHHFSASADVNEMPPLRRAVPLGIQHVLAMFVGNVTVPLIIAGAMDLPSEITIFLIQATLFVSGTATLVQALGFGPLGARLPIVMGTSFGFVPVLLPIALNLGLPAALGATLCAGVTITLVGVFLPRVRFLFPPVVTGTFVLMIGVLLLPMGFAYAGGGFDAADFGASHHLLLAGLVFAITLGCHQFARGFWSEVAPLIGLVAGFVTALATGLVDLSRIGEASWFTLPQPLAIGIEFHWAAILPMVLLALVTCAESIGDIVGTTAGGLDRQPTERELSGGVMADGIASVFAAGFNAFPQISFSQNVGMVALTGVVSRFVVAIGGGFLLVAGLLPKLGALISSIPNAVLGGAVLIMFGMITSAGIKMLSHIPFDKRNMVIIGVSLSVAIGLPAHEDLLAGASADIRAMLDSGLIPGALCAMLLNLLLPSSAVG
ncbi:uracil-xanthine permease family protein [Halomonas llamarensis]|uniref:Purine permease n=1 Tax=Halomonas llamarensis TaxID=2945104 RepID=A0ABT0SVA4_9GAMM|nr:nucleobase:cation symporter-2 family protein [Halomonas llamarensis]MCL7931657.1 purine permease [Halomonas llamarensis]